MYSKVPRSSIGGDISSILVRAEEACCLDLILIRTWKFDALLIKNELVKLIVWANLDDAHHLLFLLLFHALYLFEPLCLTVTAWISSARVELD